MVRQIIIQCLIILHIRVRMPRVVLRFESPPTDTELAFLDAVLGAYMIHNSLNQKLPLTVNRSYLPGVHIISQMKDAETTLMVLGHMLRRQVLALVHTQGYAFDHNQWSLPTRV